MARVPPLERLNQQVQLLQQVLEQAADSSMGISARRFDRGLFCCRGTALSDYLHEIQENQRKLSNAVHQQRLPQVDFLSERLVMQIAALQRELATLPLRQREPQQNDTQQDLYQRLAQYQQYEFRLQAMIQDRESLLNRQETLAQQSQLQREMAALSGRLERCRLALQKLERYIERHEAQFHE